MAENLSTLTPRALSLATERPRHWEHRLFAQVLIDEVERSRPLLLSPSVATRTTVALQDIPTWLNSRLKAFFQISADVTSLVNSNHDDAFGPPSQTGNVSAIVVFSRRLAAFYRQTIEWVHSVRNADVDPRWRPLTYEYSFLADTILRNIEAYGPKLLGQLEVAARQPPGTPAVIEATLVLQAPDLTRINAAIARITDNLVHDKASPLPSEPGYIYILLNPSMGNLLKIGKTARSPRDRIAELSTASGVPTPFVLAFDTYVEDCSRAEAYVHARLEKDGYRVTQNREFFNVDLNTAINVVLEAQNLVSFQVA